MAILININCLFHWGMKSNFRINLERELTPFCYKFNPYDSNGYDTLYKLGDRKCHN